MLQELGTKTGVFAVAVGPDPKPHGPSCPQNPCWWWPPQLARVLTKRKAQDYCYPSPATANSCSEDPHHIHNRNLLPGVVMNLIATNLGARSAAVVQRRYEADEAVRSHGYI